VQFRLTNRSRVETSGIELAAQTDWTTGVSVGGALTYLAVDSATALRGRPQWQGNLRAGWESGAWQTLALLRWNSEFNDSAIPTGAVISPGHVEADFSAAVRFDRRLRLRFTLRNLWDERYANAVGVPAPGRSLRFSLEFE
jgi:vitamin B12 transporter